MDDKFSGSVLRWNKVVVVAVLVAETPDELPFANQIGMHALIND